MERITRVTIAVFCSLGIAVWRCGGPPPAVEKPVSKSPQWYLARYPFMDDWGKVFTFESEFDWPAGFTRPDSASLSPFSFWVSHFPLYHSDRPVGSFRHGIVKEVDEICRTVDFKWRLSKLRDDVIPIQILGEYYKYLNIAERLAIEPKLGDTMIYRRWLESKVVYGPRRNLKFIPSAVRPDSEREFSRFFDLCANNTDYAVLRKNCVPVPDTEVLPGDLYIASNHNGAKGRVYVILCMLIGRGDEKVYAVGTGCDNACDFHIPLVNESRSNPWLSTEHIKDLAQGYDSTGFYRLKLAATEATGAGTF